MEYVKVSIQIIGLILIALIFALLGQIKDMLRDSRAAKKPGVKTGFLQTMSGKIFTVKEKRKVVYNDDFNVSKRERQAAGEIPYDE